MSWQSGNCLSFFRLSDLPDGVFLKHLGINMIRIFLSIFSTALACSSLCAQRKFPEIYLNHLSITLDSVTYSHLFDSAFLSTKFANADSSATTTTKDSWSGKYLEGKNGYFEFFSTKGYRGATTGDLGLGFISLKSGDIWDIKQHWRHGAGDSIAVDTIVDIIKGEKCPWFYSISLFRKGDSVERFSTWLMENTPAELLDRGFTEQEIQKKILWQDYVERHSHQPFSKLFNRITAVQIVITTEEYLYLKKSLLGFGLREQKNEFVNDHITIGYTVAPTPVMRVRCIEVELTEPAEDETIKINDHVVAKISGYRAIWEFQY